MYYCILFETYIAIFVRFKITRATIYAKTKLLLLFFENVIYLHKVVILTVPNNIIILYYTTR